MFCSCFSAVRPACGAFVAALLSAALFMTVSDSTELELEASGKTRQAALGNLKMSALRNVLNRNLTADELRGGARALRTEVFEHVNELVLVEGDVVYREEGDKTFARAVANVDDVALWQNVAKIPGLKGKAEQFLNGGTSENGGSDAGASPGEERRETDAGSDDRQPVADDDDRSGAIAQETDETSPVDRPEPDDTGASDMNSDKTAGDGKDVGNEVQAAQKDEDESVSGAGSRSGGYGMFAVLLSAAVFLFIMFFFSERDNAV